LPYGERDFIDFLRKSAPKKVSILTHVGADPDAICSAFALRHLVRELVGSDAGVITPERVSSAAKAILQKLAIVLSEPELGGSDLIVIVDTPSLAMLGQYATLIRSSGAPIAQIDHHYPNPSMGGVAAIRLLDEEAPSTTEIIYSLYKMAGVGISEDMAQILLTGIVAESGRLSRLRGTSLSNMYELSQRGGDVEKALADLQGHLSLDERVARLKSAQRLCLVKVEDVLIAVSHVGSYHASAARSLLALGADIVATLSKGKEGLKITVRANENYISRTGIHIGRDICTPLGEILGGEGSGHGGVGGIRAKGDLHSIRSVVLNFIEDKTVNAMQSGSDK